MTLAAFFDSADTIKITANADAAAAAAGEKPENARKIDADRAKALYTNREIIVTNSFTGDTLWYFKGHARISEKTTNGDITVHYIEDGKTRKIDFVGSTINFVSKQL